MKVEEIEKQIYDFVEQMYKAGFEYGVQYCNTEHSDVLYEKAQSYEKGLNDAWECARKLENPISKGGFSYEELEKIFGTSFLPDIMSKYSPFEAITHIKAFEEKEQAEAEDQEWGTMEERLSVLEP